MTPTETADYLRTLPAIRDRCIQVFELATQDKLQYFEYHPEKEPAVTAFCVDIIHVGSVPILRTPLIPFYFILQKAYGTDYDKVDRLSTYLGESNFFLS